MERVDEQLEVDDHQWAIRLAASSVLSMDGTRVRVRDLWQGGVAVTAFLRHYGCLFCLQFAHEVLDAAPEIVARGANLVLIGNGTVDQAKRFFGERGLPKTGCTVATDPERESYRAADFHRGYVRTFFEKGSRVAFAKARTEGHRTTGLYGDLTQLGGLTVTKPPAHLVYFHRSEHAGDHPKVRDVLDAVKRAQKSPGR
jgi:hypothetical protein